MSVPSDANSPVVLQCMDLWSGNKSVENLATSPGLEIYVFSQPYQGQARGGDVHYVSLCAGGVITRIMLADVAGHGTVVAGAARLLRGLMRRFMNVKNQNRLVHCLNREFTLRGTEGRFATAIVATYLSHRQRFTLCNAGHPRPLWYRAQAGVWSYVDDGELFHSGAVSNLPLGFDETAGYQQLALHVGEGDLLILYTDALTETRNAADQLLGENELLQIVAGVPTVAPRDLGRGILEGVQEYADHRPFEDDVTILVLRFSKSRQRIPGLAERFRGYARILGWGWPAD
ncbi:MAG: serine/threonine-protein phosphatase [Planctomycetes bacterium]|nr:serine/threonine-protein phosphatase [Planctomycetota bacterium]